MHSEDYVLIMKMEIMRSHNSGRPVTTSVNFQAEMV